MDEMKKAMVIYDSKFGNMEKIAIALKRGMEKQGVKANCVSVDEVDVSELVEYDFLAIDGPTHRRSASEPHEILSREIEQCGFKGEEDLCL